MLGCRPWYRVNSMAVMIGAIIVVPYLYLALPLWLLAGIFASVVLGILYFTVEPVLGSCWAIWAVVLVLAGADTLSNFQYGPTSVPFLLLNNAVLVLTVVGATNLWAQSGMKARDITVLAGVLALYDLVATSILPLTNDLFARVASMPFAPLVAWGVGIQQVSIGLGDLLLATTFPLVMRKAFGRSAGIAAMTITLGAFAILMALLELGNVYVAVPAMSVLGPLMMSQYGYWRWRRGRERTTSQYLQAEPSNRRTTASEQA